MVKQAEGEKGRGPLRSAAQKCPLQFGTDPFCGDPARPRRVNRQYLLFFSAEGKVQLGGETQGPKHAQGILLKTDTGRADTANPAQRNVCAAVEGVQ